MRPSGVKRDYVIYNDYVEDGAWDGVWDVATSVDSLGWTAEFKIPLSQLRYENKASHTFGFAVWRDIERYKERVSWPLYRMSAAGLASQLGEIDGLVGLPSPRRLELTLIDDGTRPKAVRVGKLDRQGGASDNGPHTIEWARCRVER